MMHRHIIKGEHIIIGGTVRERVDEVFDDRFMAGGMCFSRTSGEHLGHPDEGRWTRVPLGVFATPDTADDLSMDGEEWMPCEVSP